jgi:hypothetical protein
VADEASGADSNARSRTSKRQAVLAFAMVDWEFGKTKWMLLLLIMGYREWLNLGKVVGAVRASCVASAVLVSCLSLTS